jgi:hypothetical protein
MIRKHVSTRLADVNLMATDDFEGFFHRTDASTPTLCATQSAAEE